MFATRIAKLLHATDKDCDFAFILTRNATVI